MDRYKKITFRVSEQERGYIAAKAKRMNINISVYCRTAAMGKKIIYIDGLRELLPELNRIGNNLNQLTVLLRQRHIENPILDAHKRDFDALVAGLNDRLRGGEAA